MRVFGLLIALYFITCPAFPQSKQYLVNVNIKEGIQNGKAFIKYFTDKGPYIDSVAFSKGRFVLRSRVPEKMTIAKIYLLKGKEEDFKNENSCEIWLESRVINIEAKSELTNAAYSGSALQKQFSELQKNLLPVKKKTFVLDEAYEKAGAEKDLSAKDKLLNEDYPALFKEKQKILGAFIRRYPSSLISAYKFDEFAGDGETDLAIVEPVYELLDNSIKKHPRVLKVAERIAINKLTAPGMKAIGFTQTDTSGNPVSLSAFYGKWLLMDFWAGWCVPCRAENPQLIKIFSLHNNKGLEILGVSLDGERARWTNAIVADKLP